MATVLRAGFVYFAMVLGTGVILGMVRVPLLVPHLGERWAELAEMPIMAVVIYWSAGYLLRRFPGLCTPSRSLLAGVLALSLAVAAELVLATLLQDRSLAQYLRSRDKVSGLAYVLLLLVFAVMPRLCLPAATRRGNGLPHSPS